MLGRLHGSSMYKRGTSRDNMDSFDIDDNSGKFLCVCVCVCVSLSLP